MSDGTKHLQLGTDLELDDRTELSEEEWDKVWDDACTVEEFAQGLEELRSADPLEQWELARLRHEGVV
jgi:hypothetical protein